VLVLVLLSHLILTLFTIFTMWSYHKWSLTICDGCFDTFTRGIGKGRNMRV